MPKTLRRFLVFYGARYYPEGGMKDLQGSFDTRLEALEFLHHHVEEYTYWWAHIYDLHECKMDEYDEDGGLPL